MNLISKFLVKAVDEGVERMMGVQSSNLASVGEQLLPSGLLQF